MDRKRLIIGGVLLAVLVAAIAAGAWYYSTNVKAREQLLEQLDIEAGAAAEGGLLVSGFVEAEEVELAAEIGGRVVELPFEEGDEVEAGDVAVRLDTAIMEAERDMTRAQLDIMIAERDLVAAGPRKEILRKAQGQVALAQATLNAAEVAWQGAVAVYANPQDVEIQLIEAKTQVAVAQQELAAAQVELTSSGRSREQYYLALGKLEDMHFHFRGEKLSLPLDMTFSEQNYREAEASYQSALEALEGATAMLETLQQYVDNPRALLVDVVETQGAFEAAKAALDRAGAELADLEAGPDKEDLDVADARVEEAEAAQDVIESRIERMTISAPISGLVLQQSIHEGELAVEGVPLVTLANLDVVELTVYVAETQFDKVHLNQTVEVTVDSFPDKTFEGVVTYISDEAEFTPRSVQTREERVNLVFAVKIRIENPDHALKPGIPADALFK
jgi:HlyD family secretion protein